MKPTDITFDSSAQHIEDSAEKDPKFKVDDCVRILKCKKYF